MKHKHTSIEEISAILARKHAISAADSIAMQRSFENREDITFEEFLIDQGIVDKNTLLQALAEYYHVRALDVMGEFFDHHLVRLFPKDVLLKHNFIPYTREADMLTVVAANPSDPHLLVVIAKYITHDINFMVGLAPDIQEAIEEYYDRSNTYQPNSIANERMERSQLEVHPWGQELDAYGDPNQRIPLSDEETNDDYESH